MLATSSIDVEFLSTGWELTVIIGGGGALGFFRLGVLDGKFGVLVAIDDLYILELKIQVYL